MLRKIVDFDKPSLTKKKGNRNKKNETKKKKEKLTLGQLGFSHLHLVIGAIL